MFYHFAILLLFRPFQNLSIKDSNTSPQNICTEAAQNLFTLVRSYRDLYTLRRIPSFVPYMIVTANLSYLVDLTQATENTVGKTSANVASLSYLEEMCAANGFAERALDILDFFSWRWNVKTQEDDPERVLRSRLQGVDRIKHPATELASTDTFFLPAFQATIHAGSSSSQLGNFSSSGPILALFPQQGRQLQSEFVKAQAKEASREMEMEM